MVPSMVPYMADSALQTIFHLCIIKKDLARPHF
jgi:hypothetical protein